jgi:hypothetical protein
MSASAHRGRAMKNHRYLPHEDSYVPRVERHTPDGTIAAASTTLIATGLAATSAGTALAGWLIDLSGTTTALLTAASFLLLVGVLLVRSRCDDLGVRLGGRQSRDGWLREVRSSRRGSLVDQTGCATAPRGPISANHGLMDTARKFTRRVFRCAKIPTSGQYSLPLGRRALVSTTESRTRWKR